MAILFISGVMLGATAGVLFMSIIQINRYNRENDKNVNR